MKQTKTLFQTFFLLTLLLAAGGGIFNACEKLDEPAQEQPQTPSEPHLQTPNERILGVWAEDINEDEDGVCDTLFFHPNGSVSAVALFDQWKYQLSDERILFYKDSNYNYPPPIISGDSLTYMYSFISDDTLIFYNFLTLSVAAMIYNVKYHKIGSL